MFSASKYNAMIEAMLEDNVNFKEVFRYGEPTYKILYKGTDEPFNGTLEEALKSPDKGKLYQKIGNSEELDAILYLLKEYSSISDEQLEAVEKVYWGMNLNQIYPNPDPTYARRAFEVGKKGNPDIEQFKETDLQKMASTLQIRLIK